MKLNKKGVTIIELIVSIALISVIMLFMYKLLADITFQKDNDYFASVNQQQRIDMINKIEEAIEDVLNSSSGSVSLTKFSNSYYYGISLKIASSLKLQLSIDVSTKKNLQMYKNGTLVESWTIKGGTFAKKNKIVIEDKKYDDYETRYDMYECSLPIYTTSVDNKNDNNNTLDDITFSFIRKY